jgi:hypothetical protein
MPIERAAPCRIRSRLIAVGAKEEPRLVAICLAARVYTGGRKSDAKHVSALSVCVGFQKDEAPQIK